MRALANGVCVRVLVASCLWPAAAIAQAQAPVVSSVSPSVVSVDVSLRITGTGLGATVAANEVTIAPSSGAPVPAAVTAVSAADASGTIRRVTVKVPGGLPLGRASITIRNTVTGLASAPASLEIVSIAAGTTMVTVGTTIDLPITLQGSAAFDPSSNRVTPGTGITVNRVTVQSPTQLLASVTVSPTAPLGPRTLGVLTPVISAIAPDAFRVVSSAPQNRAPTAVIGGAATGTPGQPVALDGNGSSDPDNDALTFEWSFGDGSTGSGKQVTKTYAQAGSFTVTLTVTDGRGGSASATRAMTIDAGAPANGPPVITSSPITTAKVPLPYEYRVVATDPDNDALTYRLLAAPEGMQISAAGVISWTPRADQAGEHFVTVEARDPRDNAAQQVFSVTVTPPATLQSITVTPVLAEFTSAGAAQGLRVTGFFSDGSTVDLTAAVTGTTYESGSTGIATVSAAGVVTAVADGSTSITVRNGTRTTNAQVRVTIASTLTALELSPRRTTLRAAGATLALTLTGTYSDGTRRDLTAAPGVAYESGATAVASVSAIGMVTSVSGGRATITARLGGLSALSDIDVIVDSGTGFARGEVYDDRTGLPLPGATVTAIVDGGTDALSPTATTTDDRGRFVLPARAGTVVVRVEKAGFTTVDRDGTVPSDSVVTLLDARLSPRDTRANPLQAVFGGRARNVPGTTTLDVPAGGLAGDASVALTEISNQGLAGRVPLGWSPVAAVEIAPATLRLEQPATLRLPNLDGLAPQANVVMARYDAARRAWFAVDPAQVSPDGAALVSSVREPGQYVALVADAAPFTPPAPVVGDELAGVSAIAFPAGLTARGVVVPRSAPPGDAARAVGSVLLISPSSLPSGLVVRARVTEQFDLLDRSRVVPLPYTQDVVVYARPRLADDMTLGTKLPITPSRSFTIQQLALGTVRLDIRTDLAEDGGGIVTSGGGSLAGPGGILLDVPAGAVPSDTVVGLSELTLAQLPVSLPAGFPVLAAVTVDTIGVQFGAPADLSIVAPGGLDASSQVWLGEVFSDPFGVMRLRLVGAVEIQGARLVSRATFAGVPLAGVRTGGTYVFVRANDPLGLLVGNIRQPGGASPQAGVLVTVDTAPFADVSAADGRAVVAGMVGVPTTATANDPVTGNGGSATATLPAVQTPASFTLALGVVAPSVIGTSPAANAVDVPLDSTITITFSEPIDAASLTPESVAVRAGAAEIAGSRVLSADRLRVTFRPASPLPANAAHVVTLSTAVRDLTGNGLASPFSLAFRSVDPSKTQVPPGQITAELPDEDGFVLITGSPGTSEGGRPVTATNPRTQETATVLALADGSFRLRLAAVLGDRISLTFRNTGGAETSFTLLQFTGTDGTTSIGRDGGTVNGPGGRVARIMPRALATPGTFRFTEANAPAFPAATPEFTYRDRFGFLAAGAQFQQVRGLTLSESQNRFPSAQVADGPFTASASLVVPSDFLVGGNLRFTAVATDAAGVRTTANATTQVVGSKPQVAAGEIAVDTQFPAVYLRVPQQAQPDLQVAVDAVTPAARIDFEVVTAQAPADGAFLLVSPVDVGGQVRLLALDQFSATTVSGSTALRTTGRLLPGVTATGDLAVVEVPGGVALLTGRVTGPPAIVAVDGWPFVAATTTANGRFVLPVRAGGALTLRFLDAASFAERGTALAQSPGANRTADVGSPLGAPSSTLTVTATPDAQSLVDIGDPIVFTFAEPVDGASVNTTSIVVTDTAGRRVPGSLVRSDDGLVATFTPARRWKYATRYRYGVGLAVRAQSGATLALPFSGEFTTFAPKVVGTLALGSDVFDVAATDQVVVAGTATAVSLVDVSSLSTPVARGAVQTPGGTRGVALLREPGFTDRAGAERTGTFAVAVSGDASGAGAARVIDVGAADTPIVIGNVQLTTAPGQPAPQGVPASSGVPVAVALSSTQAYVATTAVGVQSVSVPEAVPADPGRPGRGLGPRFPADGLATASAVASAGARLFALDGSGLVVLDGTSLERRGGVSIAGGPVAVAAVPGFSTDLDGDGLVTDTERFDLALVAGGADGTLQFYRVPDPGDPVLAAVVRLDGATAGVAVDGVERLAYVALGARGVALVDLDGPWSVQPIDGDRDAIDDRVLAAVDTPGTASRIAPAVSRGVVHVADGAAGLSIVQVTPPRTRFLTLKRDPLAATPGDENSILETRTAYTTDEAVQATLSVILPPQAQLSLVIEERPAADGARRLTFPDGGTSLALADGLNAVSLRVAPNPAPGSSEVALRVQTPSGAVLASESFRIVSPETSSSAVTALRASPATLRIGAGDLFAQLSVAAVFADGSILNVTGNPAVR